MNGNTTFYWLCCELLQPLSEATSRQQSQQIISRFVTGWRDHNDNKNVRDDFDDYSMLRLVLPQRDSRRQNGGFNIKEYTLINHFSSIYHWETTTPTTRKKGQRDPVKQWLRDWKLHSRDDTTNTNATFRFAQLCIKEIAKRRSEPNSERKITLNELNQWLDEFVKSSRKQSSAIEIWQKWIHDLSFMELKFIINIILNWKVMRGYQEKLLMSTWHPQMVTLLGVIADLQIVIQQLSSSQEFSNESIENQLSLNCPFMPQLPKRIITDQYDTICNKLLSKDSKNNDYFFIEEKMDGERLQLHYSNDASQTEVRFFTRRGLDYSSYYQDSIALFFKLPNEIKNCIIDGEMVTFDQKTRTILPFGIIKSSSSSSTSQPANDNESFHPIFMVFDILYLNNTSLIEFPLWQRYQYLQKILSSSSFNNRIRILPHQRAQLANDIKRHLSMAIAANSEGIILKNSNAKYFTGQRNESWIKLKPEYLNEFGENLDLIVMGKDPGFKDSFICGLIDDNDDNDSILSFCSIANGISNDEFKQIERLTKGKWTNFKKISTPLNMKFGTKKPKEWIDPKDSIVLEIKSRALDNTRGNGDKFATGTTLFGGYCKSIRLDKPYTDCYTLEQFNEDKEYFNRHSHKNNIETNTNTPKLSRGHRDKKVPFFIKQSNELNNYTERVSTLFHGLSFYIISDYFNPLNNERLSRDQLQTNVIANDGTIIYNLVIPDKSLPNLRIISDKLNLECQSLIDRGYDILTPTWIMDCIQHMSIIPLEPAHCLNVSNQMTQLVQQRVDIYGDSYTNEIDETYLQQLIESNLDECKDTIKSTTEPLQVPLLLFQNRKFFIIPSEDQSLETKMIYWKIKLYGGVTVTDLNYCDIVIMIPPSLTRTNNANDYQCQIFNTKLNNIRSDISHIVSSQNTISIPQIPRMVTYHWIDDCIKENIQLPEENYPVILMDTTKTKMY